MGSVGTREGEPTAEAGSQEPSTTQEAQGVLRALRPHTKGLKKQLTSLDVQDDEDLRVSFPTCEPRGSFDVNISTATSCTAKISSVGEEHTPPTPNESPKSGSKGMLKKQLTVTDLEGSTPADVDNSAGPSKLFSIAERQKEIESENRGNFENRKPHEKPKQACPEPKKSALKSTTLNSTEWGSDKSHREASFDRSVNLEAAAPSYATRKKLRKSLSMTMGSEVDKKEKKFLSVEKAFDITGDGDPEEGGIYVTCRRGNKPRILPNQDSWSVLKTPTHSIYGVYDGHGRFGHDVSNFVKRHLPQIIEKDERFSTDSSLHSLLVEAFDQMQSMVAKAHDASELNASSSGTTATMVIHRLEGDRLSVAHVGDSGLALSKGANEKSVYVTPDHSPDRPDELKRIRDSGGYVDFDQDTHRIYKIGETYPAINLARAFGDIRGREAGIVSVPEIIEFKLSSSDEFLLLCSDGIWEFMTPDEACRVCRDSFLQNTNPAKDLAVESLKHWRENAGGAVDDITVVFANLRLGLDQKEPNALTDENVLVEPEEFRQAPDKKSVCCW